MSDLLKDIEKDLGGSLETGLNKGIALFGKFASDAKYALLHSVVDPKPAEALATVATAFIEEIAAAANIAQDLTHGDPFAGSRHALEAWEQQFGSH